MSWLVLTSLISLFLIVFVALLYLFHKVSGKVQALLYLFIILIAGLTSGWVGLIVNLVISGVLLAFLNGASNHKSKQLDYGDGQEGTENLMVSG